MAFSFFSNVFNISYFSLLQTEHIFVKSLHYALTLSFSNRQNYLMQWTKDFSTIDGQARSKIVDYMGPKIKRTYLALTILQGGINSRYTYRLSKSFNYYEEGKKG